MCVCVCVVFGTRSFRGTDRAPLATKASTLLESTSKAWSKHFFACSSLPSFIYFTPLAVLEGRGWVESTCITGRMGGVYMHYWEDGWSVHALLEDGWSVHALLEDGWSVHALLEDGWSVHALLEDGWSVHALLVDGWSVHALLVDGWSVHALLVDGWSVHALLVDGLEYYTKSINTCTGHRSYKL